MTISPGARLGPYEITAKLGEGGMGEVYRARDARLGRDVAIKVIPADLAHEAERVRRFELEARAASALNHPNILTVFDMGTHEGAPFLVLELLDGESLRDVLRSGALPARKAVEIAAQVARGLAAAHEAGIVHRDLKPENLFVRRGGQVKILDFGLAKLIEARGGILHDAPTVAQVTGSGVVLGTIGYMSPEQVRGEPADGRSDVFALGCVMHEMLTGERAFRAPTAVETLNAILKSDPPELAESGRRIPPALARIVRHCLEKPPEERFQSARDLAFDLESLSGEAAEIGPSARPAGRRRLRLGVAAAIAAGLGALAFLAGWTLRRAPAPSLPLITDAVVRKLTFDAGLEAEPSFSPDGNTIAYATNDSGSLDIALLPLAGGQVRKLVATAADEAQPAWSPDGTRIAYTAGHGESGRLASVTGLNRLTPFVQGRGGEIRLVPAAGGPSVRLIEQGSFAAWSPDGSEIAFQSDRGGDWNIWRVAAQGGEPRPVTADEERNFHPAWSPDGRWIACASVNGLRVAPVDGSAPPRQLITTDARLLSPRWSPDGRWIYFSWFREQAAPSLWRVAFRPDPRDAGGDPRLERVTLGESGDVDVALSRDGRRLAWSQSVYSPDLWELDRERGVLRQVSATTCAEDYPHLAADGRTLVFQSDCGGSLGLSTLDLATGLRTPLTPPETRAQFARWSPDGKAIAYVDGQRDTFRLMARDAGTLDAREIAHSDEATLVSAPQWDPAGERVAFFRPGQVGGGLGRAIAIVDRAGREQVVFRPSKPTQSATFPTFTADGRSVVFQMEGEGEPRQLWLVPVNGGEARQLTHSALEHSHPQITPARPDEILIVVDHKNVAVVSLRTGALTYLTDFDDSTLVVDYPSWSPDGSKIHFSITRKLGDLYLLDNLPRDPE